MVAALLRPYGASLIECGLGGRTISAMVNRGELRPFLIGPEQHEFGPQSGKHPTSSMLSHRGHATKPLRSALWFSKRPPWYQLLYAPAKLRLAVNPTVTNLREHGTIHNFTTLALYSFELSLARYNRTAQKIRSQNVIPHNLQLLMLQP